MFEQVVNDADVRTTGRPSNCEVEERWLDGTVVLSVRGELDMLSASPLLEMMDRAFDKSPSALVIDLTNLSSLDATGMTVLTTAHEKSGATTRFGMVANGPATRTPITLTAMESFLTLYLSLDDALTNLA
ncbi:MAG: STAS domain-containing protein [Mycobacterium sp.]